MIDHSARVNVRLRELQPKNKRGTAQAAKLESILARTYTDDTDMRLGALSAPCNHLRPGQLDDEARCTYTGMYL